MIHIKECKTCDCKNKLRCMVGCEHYMKEASKRAHQYNLIMFGDPNIYGQDDKVWNFNNDRELKVTGKLKNSENSTLSTR